MIARNLTSEPIRRQSIRLSTSPKNSTFLRTEVILVVERLELHRLEVVDLLLKSCPRSLLQGPLAQQMIAQYQII